MEKMTSVSEQEKLNERFRLAYNALEERGHVVKNARGNKGVKAFAKRIGTDGHIVAKILDKGDRNITYEQAHSLKREYGVRGRFLFEGVGPIFELETNAEIVPMGNRRDNIMLTSLPAAASYAVDVQVFETEDAFHLPGIQGEHVAFRVRGNSMQPTLNPNDMVICQQVLDPRHVRNGDIYTVVVEGRIMVKRVHKIHDDRGKISHLRLVSDNSVDHQPFDVVAGEVSCLYEVRHRLSSLG